MAEIITMHPPCQMLAQPVRDPDINDMLVAELVYFKGAHFQHIVDRDEHLRLKRRMQQLQAHERRMGSRRRHL